MENASKALLMAGEVLISIIIVSALLLMFNSLTSYQSVKEQNTREAQVIAFNNTYEAYNTKDVRGNDLYSLINRVVDYNKRKSTAGTGEKDEGQYLAYQPMTIKVSLGKDQNEIKKKFTHDEVLRVFKNGLEFTIDSTNNTFDKLFEDIRIMERNLKEYPSEALNNLATAIEKIFVTDELFESYVENDINKAKQIIYNYNSCVR